MSADTATRTRPVKVLKTVRAGTTKEGNPLYVLHTDAGLFKTRPDTAKAYEVENDFPVGLNLDVDARLYFTSAGEVWSWTVLDK